jgi:hypothetical protein
VSRCLNSGQQIVGPPRKKKEKSTNAMTQSIFDAAKRYLEKQFKTDGAIKQQQSLFVVLDTVQKWLTQPRKLVRKRKRHFVVQV